MKVQKNKNRKPLKTLKLFIKLNRRERTTMFVNGSADYYDI